MFRISTATAFKSNVDIVFARGDQRELRYAPTSPPPRNPPTLRNDTKRRRFELLRAGTSVAPLSMSSSSIAVVASAVLSPLLDASSPLSSAIHETMPVRGA